MLKIGNNVFSDQIVANGTKMITKIAAIAIVKIVRISLVCFVIILLVLINIKGRGRSPLLYD
jgi:hypothetical protein